MHAHSTGEESNSSDTGLSERGGLGGGGPPPLPPGLDLIHPKSEPQDYSEHPPTPHHNNSLVLDPSRTPNFPAALLGLQGHYKLTYSYNIKIYRNYLEIVLTRLVI